MRVAESSAVDRVLARYAPVRLACDLSPLTAGDRAALPYLRAAADAIDRLFLRQLWSGNRELHARLRADTSAEGRARLRCAWMNKGPWSALDGQRAFLPDVPETKPPGAGFYPDDASREELAAWLAGLDESSRRHAAGPLTVIERNGGRALRAVRYADAYREELDQVAAALRVAASHVDDAAMAAFLTARAEAFHSNDYAASEAAWIGVDGPLDVTVGPYETYNDALFGAKAAFAMFAGVRDEAATARLRSFARSLPELDPLARGTTMPRLRVVQQWLAAGDAAHGIHAVAFTLPNDEEIAARHGTKRVLLSNVQRAKFDAIVRPIARAIFTPDRGADVTFDAFFAHVLAHELMHGAPAAGRAELAEHFTAIDEASADVLGLALLRRAIHAGVEPSLSPAGLYATFTASAIRTLRFGRGSAHGRAIAIELAALLDRGAIMIREDGRVAIDTELFAAAVHDLGRELVHIRESGDRDAAAALLARDPRDLERSISAVAHVPVEIDPTDDRSAE